jgi:hypothetical protein
MIVSSNEMEELRNRCKADEQQEGGDEGEDNLRNRRHFGGALSPIQGPSVKHGT